MKKIIVILFLSSCTLLVCGAQSKKIKMDSFDHEFEHNFFPGMTIGKNVNSGAFKVGLSANDYLVIMRSKFHLDTFFGLPYSSWVDHWRHDRYFFIGSISLNQFFSFHPAQQYNSQSIDMLLYAFARKDREGYNYKLPLFGFGVQYRHYNFENYTISPILKFMPPLWKNTFLHTYFQYNRETYFGTPKYEMGIEIHLDPYVAFGEL